MDRFRERREQRPQNSRTVVGIGGCEVPTKEAARAAGGGSQFSIAPNPNADATAPLYELLVDSQVKDYEAEIKLVSLEVGIDPDLIRAIMYMETTHGDYGGAGPLFDLLGISKSILPMNINVRFWGDAFGPRAKLEVPLNNIRAGATILSGIIANLSAAASVAEIATLYNSLSATMVSDYGARTEAVFKSRLWERE